MSEIQIQRVAVERILDLRHRVLRVGLPPEAARFDGDDLPDTVHIAALQNGAIIGCATVLLNSWENRPACQLRGMAVDSILQRSGIGGELLKEVERIATEKSVNLVWANCRTPAVPFYKKHGWRVVSEEFDIPTAGPHFKMVRELTWQGKI